MPRIAGRQRKLEWRNEAWESLASLDTQFGDEGHGASRDALTPRFDGRVPAQENNGMAIKSQR